MERRAAECAEKQYRRRKHQRGNRIDTSAYRKRCTPPRRRSTRASTSAAGAHRARLEGDDQRAAGELPRAGRGAGAAEREHLGVRGRVVRSPRARCAPIASTSPAADSTTAPTGTSPRPAQRRASASASSIAGVVAGSSPAQVFEGLGRSRPSRTPPPAGRPAGCPRARTWRAGRPPRCRDPRRSSASPNGALSWAGGASSSSRLSSSSSSSPISTSSSATIAAIG